MNLLHHRFYGFQLIFDGNVGMTQESPELFILENSMNEIQVAFPLIQLVML